MVLDKETLLAKMQDKYMTRQEVMYRLPLNISINSFWAELLNRRKLKSIILPLHRGDGKPYWYVLTDKMIAASEKLCSLALNSEESVDPYRSSLTRAMTEELFYTSFVEGADIKLQDAMHFLERGTEPESVQEQLIQNNRNALEDMNKMLYYPLDERFVRFLAFRLTEEMEGQASDYRQTDEHTIAAMGTEAYEIPKAAAIPGLMREFYSFLSSPEIHPLIKAAVSQAYILAVRPFPEGNERLSRMISNAVLFRSGYDFFRDISISGAIAQESFRYYKVVQDILRNENDGDLTYFIDYYLDLLARATARKAKPEPETIQNNIELERAAAKVPLTKDEEGGYTPLQGGKFCGEKPDSYGNTVTLPTAQPAVSMDTETAASPPELMKSEAYLALLSQFEKSNNPTGKNVSYSRIATLLRSLVSEEKLEFTKLEWESYTGFGKTCVRRDFTKMTSFHLIVPTSQNDCDLKRYLIPVDKASIPRKKSFLEEHEELNLALQELLDSSYINERRTAEGLKDLLCNGMTKFTFAEWIQRNPAPNRNIAFGYLRTAINHGILIFENGVYRFAEKIKKGPNHAPMPEKQRDLLLQMMDLFPKEKFTIKNIVEKTGAKYSSVAYYIDNFKQRGILTVEVGSKNLYYYSFAEDVHAIFAAKGERSNKTEFVQQIATEKQIYDPLRNAEDAG